MTLQEKVKRILDDILERLPDLFSLAELEERTRRAHAVHGVFLQECERMNALLFEMRRSLIELDLGLKGDLSISEPMEALMNSLYDDKVPETWNKRAWPSLRPLGAWLVRHARAAAAARRVDGRPGDAQGDVAAGPLQPAGLPDGGDAGDRAQERAAARQARHRRRRDEEGDARRDRGADARGRLHPRPRGGLEGARWDINSGMLDDAILKQLYGGRLDAAGHRSSRPRSRTRPRAATRTRAPSTIGIGGASSAADAIRAAAAAGARSPAGGRCGSPSSVT